MTPHSRGGTRPRLSAFLIVRDEADRIGDCLDSIAGWVDQLVVFDSGSRDLTVSIARQYTDEVYQTDWPGFGAQRNRALLKCDGDWILAIDADERMRPALKAEIDRILTEPGLDATVLKLPWRTYLFGRPLRFGRYTAPQAKLFKRDGARYREHLVHESLVLPRRVARRVEARLDHLSWRDYEHLQHKHLHYACLLARQKEDAGEIGSLLYACLRFFFDFFQQYVLRLGFLDGQRGFLIAIVLGQYAFHKYAALAMQADQHYQTAALLAPPASDSST